MKFYYRKAGPSGRGEGRMRYYVDAEGANGIAVRRFLCTIEGVPGHWTLDMGRIKTATRFRTREGAARASML